MSNHFIGVDAGGTHTRALLATASGEVLGTGRAAGANSWSSGTSVADSIASAIRDALDLLDPASVAGGVIAIAGGGATSAEIGADIVAAWRSLRLPGTPDLVIDVVAAYAAGTTAPNGVVLAAGTGAIAAAIRDGDLQQRSGGHGWLVGDEGSAVWLGINGVRAVLMALDGRGPETAMTVALCEVLEIQNQDATSTAAAIVDATLSRPPAELGKLAPIVVQASEAGDQVARSLTDQASAYLIDLIVSVAPDEPPEAIVLAGSLLTRAAPIVGQVRADLSERWPGAPITEAANGEAGAVSLAISRHSAVPVSPEILTLLRG